MPEMGLEPFLVPPVIVIFVVACVAFEIRRNETLSRLSVD